jgi:hypothetical protein
MSIDTVLAAEEKTRDFPAPPIVYGIVVFATFVVLIVAVLMFGKGRPHP